ncbi:MAG TPA: hypothetical protein VIO38_10300, partial [Rariglobus sp.]
MLNTIFRFGPNLRRVVRGVAILGVCVAVFSGVHAGTTAGEGLFSAQLLERSLKQPAPKWTYVYTKRQRDLDGAFAFYTLSLAAH